MTLIADLNITRWLLGTLVVALLLGGFALLAWRVRHPPLRPGRHRKRRIHLVESLPLDARRRLCLVRVDDMEHLLLLSPAQDIYLFSDPAGEEAELFEEDRPIGFLRRVGGLLPVPMGDEESVPPAKKQPAPKKAPPRKKPAPKKEPS